MKKLYANLYIRLFTSFVDNEVFPSIWKMIDLVPIQLAKNFVKNCRPVLPLPVFGKICEHLVYNEMYPYLIDNNLISQTQSGDSCAIQFLLIIREIYKNFSIVWKIADYS